MTDSTSLTRSNDKEALLERLSKYDSTPAQAKEEVSQLPRWVKTALVLQAVDGLSYNEAAKRFNKAGSTLSNYAKSPAAKKWLASLMDFLEDPVAMAKAYLRGNALSVTLERMAFLEAAVAAGDYKEGDKIARDIQDRLGIVTQKGAGDGKLSITLKLGGGGSIEAPEIEASYAEAEYEVVEDD